MTKSTVNIMTFSAPVRLVKWLRKEGKSPKRQISKLVVSLLKEGIRATRGEQILSKIMGGEVR